MKSHLKDFEQSNSMAHKTSWLVGAIELVKKYNGRDSVFYHTLSANDFYIQASSIEDKTVIRDKLDQKEKRGKCRYLLGFNLFDHICL